MIVRLARFRAVKVTKGRLVARFGRWPHRYLILLVSGLVLPAVLGGLLDLKFPVTFATNPFHGEEPFGGSGREIFLGQSR